MLSELLVLKPDVSLRKSRVSNVDSRLAIQHDDEVIPVGGDLKGIPLIRFECVVARGFRRADDTAGVVAGRLLLPDLHLVAASFFGERTYTPLLVSSAHLNSIESTKFLKL